MQKIILDGNFQTRALSDRQIMCLYFHSISNIEHLFPMKIVNFSQYNYKKINIIVKQYKFGLFIRFVYLTFNQPLLSYSNPDKAG